MSPHMQFFRLYADRVPPNLFDRLRYIIQVCSLVAATRMALEPGPCFLAVIVLVQ